MKWYEAVPDFVWMLFFLFLSPIFLVLAFVLGPDEPEFLFEDYEG